VLILNYKLFTIVFASVTTARNVFALVKIMIPLNKDESIENYVRYLLYFKRTMNILDLIISRKVLNILCMFCYFYTG
jgi:hypothetical protein